MSNERIKDLFERAARLPPAVRAEFLGRECGGDEGLRREVQSLLAHDPSPDFLLESVPQRLRDGLVASGAPRIDGYELLERIGGGGMGSVWRALRHHDGFTLQVAVKVLHLGMDTGTMVRRFQREQRILSDLDHPGIARLMDGGTCDDGRPFVAMEYVAGSPIDEFARSLPLRARLELLVQTCDAVAAAHQKGVVHRDLKPANVLVKADGTVKLLDFGIAKLLEQDEHSMTRTGERLMTPRYAAPEQFTGAHVGTFTDVWALGAILHELSTGQPLFAPETPLHEVETSVLRGTLPPPSRCVARTRHRELTGDIDVIALRALAVDPARRYPTAEALGLDLRRHLAHQTIAARRDSVTYRLGKFVRRHRTLVAGAVGTAVALSVGLAMAVRAYAHAEDARVETEFAANVSAVAAAQGALQRGDAPTARKLLETVPEPLREFEWHHVAAQLDTSTCFWRVAGASALKTNYDISVNVRFHPDGRRVVATGEAGMRVWDLATGALLAAAKGPDESGFRPFVFGPGGDTFAWVPEFGRSVEVWSVDPLQHKARLGVPSTPRSLTADASGRRCAVGLTSGELIVLDLATQERLGHFEFDEVIDSIAFEPNRDAVILTAGSTLLHLDLESGSRRTLCELSGRATRAIAHHPLQPLVAVGLAETIWLVDTESGQVTRALPGSPYAVAFSPDGEHLATALGYDGLRVFRTVDYQRVLHAAAGGGKVTCVAFDPSGYRVVCGYRDLAVRVYDLELPTPHTSRLVHGRDCNFVAPSRDGRWLASHGSDRVPRIHDAHTMEQVGVLLEPRVRNVVFTPASELLGIPFEADQGTWPLTVFELPNLTVRRRLSVPMQPTSLVFAPAGDSLFVSSSGRNVARLRWPEASVVWSEPLRHDYWAFAQDGSRLALARGRELTFVDAASGVPLGGTREPAHGTVRSMSFFANDTRLATVGLDGFLCVFDVASGRKLVELMAHGHGVQDIHRSPDGRRLLTAGRDGLVKLWDPVRCVEVFSERVHSGWTRARFDAEGDRILFATSAGQLGWLAKDFSRQALPNLEAARSVRSQVTEVVARLEAAHGDDTAAAMASLAALPDLPDEVRRQSQNRVHTLPGEPRWLLARAWRTALDPAADRVEIGRSHNNMWAVRGVNRAQRRVVTGMLQFRRDLTKDAVLSLMGGEFPGLEPDYQQARCLFLVLTLVAQKQPRQVPALMQAVQESVATHSRRLPDYWFEAADKAVANLGR
ncbi:MAG: protein kinase [Planctomycetes bacterium]|nr:protein kinase [Planctomycetota bacterium]